MLHSVDLGTAHFFIKVTSMNHVSRSTFRSTALVISLGLAGVLAATAVQAKPFKWSSASDIPTLDIHSQNNALGNGVHAAIFDSLVYYNSKSFKVEPKLATSWKEMSPTQYRFNLRKGVKFSDGSALTADDVVFSLDRARAKTSNFNVYTQGFSRIVKVDANTVDIVLSGPNPVLLNQLTELRIMSKAWAEKNKSMEPKDAKTKDETFAHRNAMGSGAYMVKEWQPDQKLVLVKNPNWWGWSDAATNVTEVIYTPIKNEATRAAALLSGEIDFVLDPSPQDLGRMRSNANLKVIDGVENRTIFLGMDQHRDELPGSSVKGKNPLKDVKVRKALYQAIDIDTIQRVTMRGLSQPTGALVSSQVNGWTEVVNKRLAYSQDDAKKLLAEAGYPQGFEVDFACPNNRYINDEEICQAITAMWAKVGIKAKLRTMPLVTYFPMIQRYEASIYMLGWGVPTFDALYSLQSLTRSVGTGGDGNYNVGRYSNTRMDYIVDRVKTETDLPVRNRLMTEGLQLSNDTVSHIPLHNQVIPWAMKKNIDLVHRADNRLDWTLIKVN
jgi:peptide/nickel transport system substrate-binding protein